MAQGAPDALSVGTAWHVSERGLHPAWVLVAGVGGAALALVGAWIPLSAARSRLSDSRAEREELALQLRAAQDQVQGLEDRTRRLEDSSLDSTDQAEKLAEAQAELARLRQRLSEIRSQRRRSPSARDPRLAGKLQAEAHAKVREGKLDEALSLLDGAIQADPQRPDLLVDRAFVRFKAEDPLGAVADCEAALRLDSQHAMAWNNLAMVRCQQQDGPGALKFARRALECDPDLLNAWIMRVSAAALTKDWAEVELAARGALERLPLKDPRRKVVTDRLLQARSERAGEAEAEESER